MSKLYLLEMITAEQGSKKVEWFYEGQDEFSKSFKNDFIKGKELEKQLFNAIKKGWKVKGVTKDGVKADIYIDKFGLHVSYKQ